jgi:hypothetical protein
VLAGASAVLFAVSLASMRPGLLLVKQERRKGRIGSPVTVKGGGV